MAYQTVNILIKPNQKALYQYFQTNCMLAKNIYNATLFRCRQILTADKKPIAELTANELEILNEFQLMSVKENCQKLLIPSYQTFDKVYKMNCNPDYRNALSTHSTQYVIKEVLQDMRSFFASIKEYQKCPEKFKNTPKLPKYKKTIQHGYKISNQESVIKTTKTGICKLKLPKTKLVINLGTCISGRLMEVNVQPFYDAYKISIVADTDCVQTVNCDKKRIIGIDLGINNFAATNNNCGLTPFIINGRPLKSYNQWYNKTIAKLQSYSATQNGPKHISCRMKKLYRDRYTHTEDFYNKAASYIIRYCQANNIGTVVVGKNDGWKQNVNMGHQNNQTFTNIAHAKFIKKLMLMGEKYNIDVIPSEESYTSKASLLDNDDMPVWNEKQTTEPVFSGKRIKRGLYQSADGIKINADVNGAGNVIRKKFKNVFQNITDMNYMTKSVERVTITM